MVKITDIKDRNKKEHTETKEQYNNVDPTKKQKYNNISVRLPENILNQLNIYSQQTGQTKTNIITDLIKSKFENKRITRDYFILDKPTSLLIPTETELIKEYMEKEINLIVDIYKKQENITLQPYTQQETIYKKYKQDLKIINIKQVNNTLDKWDNIEHYYYSLYHLENTQTRNLNHLGVLFINLENTNNKLIILVHCYKNNLCSAKIINIDTAKRLATETNNTILLNYLEHQKEINKIYSIVENRDKQEKYKNMIQKLQQENRELKEQRYNYDTDILQTLTDKNKKLESQLQSYKQLESILKKVIDIYKE